MERLKIAFVCVFSALASFVTFMLAHIVFGMGYVLRYFFSVFSVSIIPLWCIIYLFLRNIYKHYYKECIVKIFAVEENDNIVGRIFGINGINIAITTGIAAFILACYVYFGETEIMVVPEYSGSRIYSYCLGIIPAFCGSFSGAIMIRSIVEAAKFLKCEIRNDNISNYIFLLRRLKKFLSVSIVGTYVMCFMAYVTVLLGPHAEIGIQQPMILFLFFLILWPAVIHGFCRIYLELVRERYFEEKFKEVSVITAKGLKEEIDVKKNMAELFAGYNDKYRNVSLLLSLLLSVSQIIVVFLE